MLAELTFYEAMVMETYFGISSCKHWWQRFEQTYKGDFIYGIIILAAILDLRDMFVPGTYMTMVC